MPYFVCIDLSQTVHPQSDIQDFPRTPIKASYSVEMTFF